MLSLFAALEKLLGTSEPLDLLRRCYAPGETFGSAFGKLFTELFTPMGLVFIDPSDPELHQIVRPIYQESLKRWREINAALAKREQELQAAGYHAQVKVTPSHTLCFYVHEGVRLPIRHDHHQFVAGELRFNEQELLSLVAEFPDRFSPNVLLRP